MYLIPHKNKHVKRIDYEEDGSSFTICISSPESHKLIKIVLRQFAAFAGVDGTELRKFSCTMNKKTKTIRFENCDPDNTGLMQAISVLCSKGVISDNTMKILQNHLECSPYERSEIREEQMENINYDKVFKRL